MINDIFNQEFVGPQDPWDIIRVDKMRRILESEDMPFLWKIGGYYVWWDQSEGWTIDGSQPCDPAFLRHIIFSHGGNFKRMQ